jgi:GDPmannose 4,6-dehydratase
MLNHIATCCTPRQVIVAVDPRYFRPTEVETLLGDPSEAEEKLGWKPKTTFNVRAPLQQNPQAWAA